MSVGRLDGRPDQADPGGQDGDLSLCIVVKCVTEEDVRSKYDLI